MLLLMNIKEIMVNQVKLVLELLSVVKENKSK